MPGSGFHRDAVGLDVHVPHSFTYADAAARVAAVSADFTDTDDLFKLARQTSDMTYWVLEQITPSVTWNQLGVGGAADLPFDAITDPAVDAAVTTAKIDVFSGTVITLTAAGNSQTLQVPTDTTAGRKFFVINNDTSNNTITVNSVLLGSGQYAEFRWDGDAWIFTTGGAAATPGGLDSQVQYNNGGVLGGDANHTWDDVNKKETIIGDVEQVGGKVGNLYTPTVLSTTTVGLNPRYSVALGSYVYIVDQTDGDLRIYDVTDPAAPVLTGQLAGLGDQRGCDIAGRYLFSCTIAGNLNIIDIRDKSAPVLVSQTAVGGNHRGIRVRGTKVYITGNANPQVNVIDVTDVENPIVLGGFNVGQNVRAEFDVVDDYIYVVTTGSTNNFIVYDATDPANIVLLSSIDIGNTVWAVQVVGSYAYTIQEGDDRLEIYDVSDPDALAALDIIGFVSMPTIPSSPRVIRVLWPYAYVVDALNDTFFVFDISDPTTPVIVSNELSVGANPISIAVIGRHAYVTDNTDDNFKIIDLTGIRAQSMDVGALSAGEANVIRDMKVGGAVNAQGGLFGIGGVVSDGPMAAAGRILGGKPKNIVEIYKEADFPIVSTDIVLATGTVYVLMAPISTDKQILHPASGGAFSPAKIVSSNKELNTLTSTGTGGAFLRTQSGQGQLILQNLIITSTGSRVFADVSGLTQTALLTELDDTALSGFNDGSVFDTCIFNANNNSFWAGIGDFTLIDAEANWTDMFTANTVDSGLPTADIRSSSGSVQPSFFAIRDSKLSSHPNEDFFMIHSNLIAGSVIRINGVEASPFTPGTGGFFASQTGAISALADSTGAPGVRTLVTASGHNVADGDTIIQSGFATQTQNNGTFVVSNVVAGVSYEIVAVFVATDTGTWTNNSLDQTDPKVVARDNPGRADSKSIGTMNVSGNTTATAIVTLNTYTDLNLNAGGVAGSNIERWSLTDTTTGEMTYNGIEPFSGTILAQISTTGETGSPEFRFRAVKNGNVLADGIETIKEAGAVQIVTTPLVAPVAVVNGDTIRLQVNNIDDATDITIVNLSVSIQ